MFEKIRDMIEGGRTFLVTTHIDPDGDALGSAFSLYWALSKKGKSASVYMRDSIPYRYGFLPDPPEIFHELPDKGFDAIFVLDCGSLVRVGEGSEKLKDMGPVIAIDHHNANEAFGSINVVDEHASSTAEILYHMYEALNMEITAEMAVNIYTAVFTDTGSFRYENTNSEAFLICEKMMRKGVEPARVARMVHENHPKERFLLLGLVLNTLETYDENRVALAHVTEEMFIATSTTREHTDGFVEYIREIGGVEVAILVRQLTLNKYKLSMRSKGVVDVARVCRLFGGGGHKNAAGCTIDGDMDMVRIKIREALNV